MNNQKNSFERKCQHCSVLFSGNYNSSSCQPCRKMVKLRATLAFKKRNPNYGKKDQARRRADGRTLKTSLIRLYGINVAYYENLIKEQDNCCAICLARAGGWRANAGKLVVDHCHKENKVRGLLCPSCNRGLGQFEDSATRLLSAVKYVCRHKHKGKPVEDIQKAIDCLIKYKQNLEKENV